MAIPATETAYEPRLNESTSRSGEEFVKDQQPVNPLRPEEVFMPWNNFQSFTRGFQRANQNYPALSSFTYRLDY